MDESELLNRIFSKYPALSGHPYSIIDSRGKSNDGRQLEFYPPDESYNPLPGRATVEIFNPELQGDELDSAVFGDMLHYLPAVDKNFMQMRQQYSGSLTPEQRGIDKNAYMRAIREEGERRPFNEWFDKSRLDAHLRGYLAPDVANEWADMYTPEQKTLLDNMMKYLQSPK